MKHFLRTIWSRLRIDFVNIFHLRFFSRMLLQINCWNLCISTVLITIILNYQNITHFFVKVKLSCAFS